MKRKKDTKIPKLPGRNQEFWIGIAKNKELKIEFKQRGNKTQIISLNRAIKYLEWLLSRGRDPSLPSQK